MSNVAERWSFWLDVGGTFTDCLALRPDGELLRRKVLSSSRVKGDSNSTDDRKSASDCAFGGVCGGGVCGGVFGGASMIRRPRVLAHFDHVFLRPHQSEFVFLQFGELAVFDGARIVERWSPFA